MKIREFSKRFKVTKSLKEENAKRSLQGLPLLPVRSAVKVSFAAYEVADVANIDASIEVAEALNFVLQGFATELLDSEEFANSVPGVEKITIANWWNWYGNSVDGRKNREVTKARLQKFAELYEKVMVLHGGKSSAAAASGAVCIRERWKNIAGNSAVCAVMIQNLASFLDAIVSSGEDSELFVQFSEFENLYDILEKELRELVENVVTVDAI